MSVRLLTSRLPLTNIGIIDRKVANRELLTSDLNTNIS